MTPVRLTKRGECAYVLRKCGLFLRFTWWGGTRWTDRIHRASDLRDMYPWDCEKLLLRHPCSDIIRVAEYQVSAADE